jgi:lysophospholipase L1-like esterase
VIAADEAGPYLRGVIGGRRSGSFSRLPDPLDDRLPADVVTTAGIPAGARVEFVGDAPAVELLVSTGAPHPKHPASMASEYVAWVDGRRYAAVPAAERTPTARVVVPLPDRAPDVPVTVHLPERLVPDVHTLRAVGGQIVPAPARPRWIAYGDSITQGWSVTDPAESWPALVARRLDLDCCNLGFAAAGRGELPVAEQIGGAEADVVSLAFGTNCWTREPMGSGLLGELLRAFIGTVRSGLPEALIVVLTPIVRPDAETVPNRFGATLEDLRASMAHVGAELAATDPSIEIVDGTAGVAADQLVDGIHPGPLGHRRMARAVLDVLTAGPFAARSSANT